MSEDTRVRGQEGESHHKEQEYPKTWYCWVRRVRLVRKINTINKKKILLVLCPCVSL